MKKLFKKSFGKIAIFGIVCILLFAVISCDRKNEPQPLSSEKEIISFTVDGLIEYTMSIFEYVDRDYEFAAHIHAVVSFETDLASLAPHIVVSPGATISPESGIPQNFSGIRRVEYIITAEDATTARVVVFIRLPSELQVPHYYWFRGERIYLTMNTDYVHVIVDDGFREFVDSSSLFQIISEQIQIQGIVKLRLRPEGRPKLTVSEYLEIIDVLKQSGKVRGVFPFFERGGGIAPIATSYVFYLKLKEIDDIAILKRVAERHNVQIVRQVPYMPLWYILSAQGSIFWNSIEASNYFFETGYFDTVDPAFMFTFRYSAGTDSQSVQQ